MAALRRKLVKQILKKGVDLGNSDPMLKSLMKNNEGESMLFLIDDIKGTYGFVVHGDHMEFVENPNLDKEYNLIASCNENTFIHILRGLDPDDAFWAGYVDVTGKGWFRRVMFLRRFFKVGETRGLKAKVIRA